MLSRSTEEVITQMKVTLASLRALRNETKLRVHLATEDVQKSWYKLQPKLDEAELVVQRAKASASEALLEEMIVTAEELQRIAAAV